MKDGKYGPAFLTKAMKLLMQGKILSDANKRFYMGVDWAEGRDMTAAAVFEVEQPVMHTHDDAEVTVKVVDHVNLLPARSKSSWEQTREAMESIRELCEKHALSLDVETPPKFSVGEGWTEYHRRMIYAAMGVPRGMIGPEYGKGEVNRNSAMVQTFRQNYGGPNQNRDRFPPFTVEGTVTGRFQSHKPNPPSNVGTKEERMPYAEVNTRSPWVKASTEQIRIACHHLGVRESEITNTRARREAQKQIKKNLGILGFNLTPRKNPPEWALSLFYQYSKEVLKEDCSKKVLRSLEEESLNYRISMKYRTEEGTPDYTPPARASSSLNFEAHLNSPILTVYICDGTDRLHNYVVDTITIDNRVEVNAFLNNLVRKTKKEFPGVPVRDVWVRLLCEFRTKSDIVPEILLNRAEMNYEKERGKYLRSAAKSQRFAQDYGQQGEAARAALREEGKTHMKPSFDRRPHHSPSAAHMARMECHGIGKTYQWKDAECHGCSHRDSCAKTIGYKSHLHVMSNRLNTETAEAGYEPRRCSKPGHADTGCMCPREEELVNGMTEVEAREWLIHRRGVSRHYVDQMHFSKVRQMVKELMCAHGIMVAITYSVAKEMGYDVGTREDEPTVPCQIRACKGCGKVFWVDDVACVVPEKK